jgi:hypothetical protein
VDIDQTQVASSDALSDGEDTGAATTPPYMSFPGMLSLLDRLQADGCPQLFDRSFFGNQSGALIAQVRGGLRFFGLMDDDKRPTDALRTLVTADPDTRKATLRAMAQERYPEAIRLGEDNGTQAQLEESFKVRGLTGSTQQKAITFYLALAEYTELPVSPFFKQGRSTNGAARAQSGRKIVRRRKPTPEPPQQQQRGARADDPIEAKRLEYIDMLMELAKREPTGESDVTLQVDLLDRIERALGFEKKGEKISP